MEWKNVSSTLNNTRYRTKDFSEAALLIASGVKLSDVERTTPRFFVFEDYHRAVALTEAFWRGDAIVNARSFVDATRRVKDLIYRGQ